MLVYAVHNDTDHIHGHIILIQLPLFLRDINTIIKTGIRENIIQLLTNPDMQGAWFICWIWKK